MGTPTLPQRHGEFRPGCDLHGHWRCHGFPGRQRLQSAYHRGRFLAQLELTAAAQKGLIFQGLREGLLSQLAEFESPSGDLILYRHVNRNRVSDGIRVRRHQFLESRPVLVGSGQIFQTLSLDHQIPGQIDRAII